MATIDSSVLKTITHTHFSGLHQTDVLQSLKGILHNVQQTPIHKGDKGVMLTDDHGNKYLIVNDGSKGTIHGSSAGETIVGGNSANTTIVGGKGGEVLIGGSGDHQVLKAGPGGDTLYAGSGVGDKLVGGPGNDTLIVDVGSGTNATLTGGAGADTFIFRNFDTSKSFKDVITDFGKGHDVLKTEGGKFISHVDNAKGGAVVTFNDGSTVQLKGVKVSQLKIEASDGSHDGHHNDTIHHV